LLLDPSFSDVSFNTVGGGCGGGGGNNNNWVDKVQTEINV
jgi:hypothetical protein